MTNLELTIAVLEQLKQPFQITSDKLIITPTSSQMLETLPGDWFDTDDSTELHIDLIKGPFICPLYIAQVIEEAASML